MLGGVANRLPLPASELSKGPHGLLRCLNASHLLDQFLGSYEVVDIDRIRRGSSGATLLRLRDANCAIRSPARFSSLSSPPAFTAVLDLGDQGGRGFDALLLEGGFELRHTGSGLL